MGYEYIRRMYGVDPVPGERVFQRETKEWGTILPERASHGHYVNVQFDNGSTGLNHPKALRYQPLSFDPAPPPQQMSTKGRES